MISDKVTKVCFFEVNDEDERASYGNRVDWPVDAGKHLEQIRDAASVGKLPGDIIRKPDPGSKHPDRFLDIREHKSATGVRAYAFRLNAVVNGKHRLRFVASQPIVKLPLHSSTKEDFLTGVEFVSEQAGGWAFFLCDLDAVRNNALADRIRAAAAAAAEEDDAAHPQSFLSIPFYFNLYDPELEAAPWVVPPKDASAATRGRGEHADLAIDVGEPIINHGGVHPDLVDMPNAMRTRVDGPQAAGGRPPIVNHGGVHPAAASFLTVEL